MIVSTSIKTLRKLLKKKISVKELEEKLFLLKAEVEGIEGDVIDIEINPDRQDMLSPEGIALALRAFLEIEVGIRKYPVKKSKNKIIVKKGLSKIRPYIACGIALGVEVNDELIKDFMHLQESLTATHGRNRSKASIGLYVHDEIVYPIQYRAVLPKKIKFTPLGYDKEMDGPTIIESIEKGHEFGRIISEFKKWPLLTDAKGKILSLPPIINSNDLGRVVATTENIFVEVTGTHLPTVQQALNIMIMSLAERGGRIESVTVEYPDGTVHETPDLKPRKMKISRSQIDDLLGLSLSNEEVISSLQKMGYDARIVGKSKFNVQYPTYRTDILHPVDIIEDIAIGYGFDRIEPTMPSTMTTGKLTTATRLKNRTRDIMIGMGYQEVLSYILSSSKIMNDSMLRQREYVATGNPKSQDYSIMRNALLPVLLSFLSKNQHVDLPQRIFEVGDIVIPDEKEETRSLQQISVSGLVSDTKVNVTNMIAEIGFLLRNLGLEDHFEFKRVKCNSFIDGRCADILVHGKPVGRFGEIKPEVLSNFEIEHPVIGFEIGLPRNRDWKS